MKELYIVEAAYIPTAASTNRLFAFGHELYKKGVKIHFFYLFPDRLCSKSDRYNDEFSFHYLWDDSPIKEKYFCTVRSILKLYRRIDEHVPVYAYAILNCLYFIGRKKGVRLYHEYTENPEVIGRINNSVGSLLYSLYKKAVKRVDCLFVITPSLKEYYVHEFNIEEDKVEVLNMVVDKHRFEGLDNVEISNTITYCGIISEAKDGVSYLIKAFALLLRKHKDVKLRLIGPFENEEVKQMVHSLIQKEEIQENVILTGPVSPNQMPALLKSSKILALARPRQKVDAYGFATKVGEYLMTERPVVMTDVGNVTDYLTDRENVILARPNDECDFADNLLWVLDHYEEAAVIGKKGKDVALRYFNSEIEADKIYKRIFS